MTELHGIRLLIGLLAVSLLVALAGLIVEVVLPHGILGILAVVLALGLCYLIGTSVDKLVLQ